MNGLKMFAGFIFLMMIKPNTISTAQTTPLAAIEAAKPAPDTKEKENIVLKYSIDSLKREIKILVAKIKSNKKINKVYWKHSESKVSLAKSIPMGKYSKAINVTTITPIPDIKPDKLNLWQKIKIFFKRKHK